MSGIKIHQYPLERLIFGDDDYYDIDYWDGAGYQTAKIKGSVIKAAILAGADNLFTNDLTLSSNRTHELNANSFKINGGGFMQFGDVTANLLSGMIIDAQDFYVRTADPAGDGTFQTIGGSGWQARVVSNTGQYIGDLTISGPVLTGEFTDGGLGTNVNINPGLFIVSNDNGSDLVSFTLTNSNIQKMITDTATSNATLFVQDNTQIQSIADNQVSGTGSIIHQKADGLSISNFGASGKQVDLFWDNVNNKFTIEDRRITATGLEYWANYHASYTNRTLVDKEYVDNVAAAIDLNSLTDVTTGLPGTPTQADDGKMLFYDYDAGQWITDDAVTHGTVVINCKKSTVGTIAKGLPVYLVGFDADLHTVELADATSSATMPVIGFTAEALDNTNSKHVTTFGKLTGIDTTSTVSTLNPNGETWAVNDALYISTTAGGLTKVRPTGGTTQIQRIAKVLKVDATGGQIFVFNTARTAGLPNLGTDKLWIGDANGIPQEVDKSTLGGASIYTQDGTIGSGRVATLTDTLTFKKQPNINALFIEQEVHSASDASSLIHMESEMNNSTNQYKFITGQERGTGQNYFEITSKGDVNNSSNLGIGFYYSNAKTQGVNYSYTGIVTTNYAFKILADVGTKNVFNLYSGTNNITGRGYLQFRNYNDTADRIFLTRTGKNFINPDNVYESDAGLVVMGENYISSEIISLQGRTAVKGADTFGTNTALEIYNGDTAPAKLWDFRNNGDVVTGQSIVFQTPVSNAGISNYRPTSAVNNGTAFFVDLNNSSNNRTSYGWFGAIIRQNTAGSEYGSPYIYANINGTMRLVSEIDVFNNKGFTIDGTNFGGTSNLFTIYGSGSSLKLEVKNDGTLDMNNNRITNTIVNPTVQETTSAATFTINATNENTGVLTAQAVALTVANPTGTIVQGQKLVYRIKDNGTARAITWGANFRAIGVTLPTTTTANKLLYVGCIYNTTDSKWDVIAVNEEA
jgi:hypothetical protein